MKPPPLCKVRVTFEAIDHEGKTLLTETNIFDGHQLAINSAVMGCDPLTPMAHGCSQVFWFNTVQLCFTEPTFDEDKEKPPALWPGVAWKPPTTS